MDISVGWFGEGAGADGLCFCFCFRLGCSFGSRVGFSLAICLIL